MFERALVRVARISRLEPRHLIGCEFIRLIQTGSQHNKEVANRNPCEYHEERRSKAPFIALSAAILGTGAVVYMAKTDEDFRKYLEENAPAADRFVAVITAEEMSLVEWVMNFMTNLKNEIVDDIANLIRKQMGRDKEDAVKLPKKGNVCEDGGKPFRAPHSAFKALSSGKETEKYEEARMSIKGPGHSEKITTVPDSDYKDKKKPKHDAGSDLLNPDSLVSLEKEINTSAEAAIRAYILAGCYLKELSEDIYAVMNASLQNTDKKLWADLKKKSEDRNVQLEKAETAAKEAEDKLTDLKHRLDEPDLPGGDVARSTTYKNIEKVLKQLEKARKEYENQRNNASVNERLWTKILEARQHFLDEIATLNPQFRLTDKEIKMQDSEMNIFIHAAIMTALSMQTEFTKMDTVGKQKLQGIIEMSRKGDADAVDEAIELEIEKEKRKISMEYYKKLLVVKADCEQKTKQALASQGLDFEEMMEDALAQKEKEVMRRLTHEFDEALMEEKEKQRAEMAGFLGRLKGMDDLMKERACQKDKSSQLWSAAEALQAAVIGPKECLKTPTRPLDNEIQGIKNLNPDDDELITNALAAVPQLAIDRGLYTATSLKERFINVKKVAGKVAFLPEGGASLPVMVIQFLKAILIIAPANPVPCFELLNLPFDPENLDNYEILQRAQFYMDKGDWYMVLGYMNQLKGASRAVAQDYVNELRLYLETKLVADSILFYASASSLAL